MRSHPRVLVPYLATHLGGVRRLLEAGLPELTRRGIPVTYAELCRNEPDMDAMERVGVAVDRSLGVPGPAVLSRRRGAWRLAGIAASLPRLAHVARRLSRALPSYDVCWVHGHRELLLVIAAARASGRATPPVVWHWHGPPLSLDAGARGLAERLLTRAAAARCARVIAVSEFCARQATDLGVPPERVRTVWNAARVGPWDPGDRPAPPAPARGPGEVVLFLPCASIRPHKGVHLAVDALAHLSPNHVLWVSGDPHDPVARPYLDDLAARAARAGAVGRVRFIGRRPDVHAVMSLADAVLVPSIWDEPFGLVAAEAQLLGVPVVVSSRGALPELAAHGRAGMVVPAGDAAGLAAAVALLMRDAALRRRLVEHGHRSAEAYSYVRWCAEMAAVLVDVGSGGRERRGAAVAAAASGLA